MSSQDKPDTQTLYPETIISFWQDAGPAAWFEKNQAFDEEIRLRFSALPDRVINGEFDDWLSSSNGALALVLILDQFPRNIYRLSADAYRYDIKARQIARHAVDLGYDQQVEKPLKPFFYLPFMHSEDIKDQLYCIELYRKAKDPEGEKYAELHAEIIRKFNRFPHRNEVLGRASTDQELEFLDAGGFKG